MMVDLKRLGGFAALIEASLYVLGFALFLTVLDPSGYTGPHGELQFLIDNRVLLYTVHLLIYVLFGLLLVVLALAIDDHLGGGRAHPALRIATVFGLIWAGVVIASGMVANVGVSSVLRLFEKSPDDAAALWRAVSTVQEALGGGNEVLGGLWLTMLSLIALRGAHFPKLLCYLGLAVGLAGVLTVVPAFGVFMAVFGLGQIVWFGWIGVVLLRG